MADDDLTDTAPVPDAGSDDQSDNLDFEEWSPSPYGDSQDSRDPQDSLGSGEGFNEDSDALVEEDGDEFPHFPPWHYGPYSDLDAEAYEQFAGHFHHCCDHNVDEDSEFPRSLGDNVDLGDLDEYKSVCDEEAHSFPQFMRLPPEIRYLIWQQYSPALTVPARILDFQLAAKPRKLAEVSPPEPVDYVVFQGPSLANSTRRVRKLLAVHQETRALVMSALPDTLAVNWTVRPASLDWPVRPQDVPRLETDGLVRFHKERDVVLLGSMPAWDPEAGDEPTKMSLEGFAESVQNAAFFANDDRLHRLEVQDCRNSMSQFPDLKNVFCCFSSRVLLLQDMHWVAEPLCRERMTYRPGGFTLGVTAEMYSWPDPNKASEWKAPRRLTKAVRRLKPHADEAGWRVLPMICFTGKDDLITRGDVIEDARDSKLEEHENRGSDASDSDSLGSDGSDGWDDVDAMVHLGFGMDQFEEMMRSEAFVDFMMYGPLALNLPQ